MATIADIGVPGQPLNSPSLVEWQKAVRDDLTPTLTSVLPASGWVDFGGAYAGLHLTRQGRLVVVSGMVKPTADKAVTAGTAYPILTGAPLPARQAIFPCVFVTSGTTPLFGRVSVDAAGGVSFIPATTVTITAAGGYVSAEFSYRSAS